MATKQRAVIVLHKPDLKEKKIFFFLSGLLVSVSFSVFFSGFADILCVALQVFFAEVCAVVIIAPFIEEFAKVFPLFYLHGETEKSIVTLAVLVILGFGVTEFGLCVFVLGVPFFVRVPGLIFHASSAGITGYGIAKKKPLRFYLVAVLLNLTNNLSAVIGTFLAVIPELAVRLCQFLPNPEAC